MQNKVFAQIYSLIRHSAEGVIQALETISEIGYDGVELIRTNTGGLSFADFKKLLGDLNLRVPSVHGLTDEAGYAFAEELGARYIVVSSDDHLTKRDELLRAADALNEKGRLFGKFGCRAAIHNHSLEFRTVKDMDDGTLIYDLLVQNTDPALVCFELDVGWCARGSQDPAAYVSRFPGRFPLIHTKECCRAARDDAEKEHFPTYVLEMGKPQLIGGSVVFSQEQMDLLYESRNWNGAFGEGLIDWPRLAAVCEAQGAEAYINEREYYHVGGANGDERLCAIADYEFLRSL